MSEFDPRIIRVSIEVNGVLKTFEGLAVVATGTKYDNSIQNECEVRIANLDKPTLDFILTETSPLNQNRTPKKIIVEAGRASWGYTQLIIGDIISAVPTQPPDIWLIVKALTANYYNGETVSKSYGAIAPLSAIAADVANSMGLVLDFQAQDKNIANWSFTGGAGKQVSALGKTGNLACYVDDQRLVLKPKREPLQNSVKIVNEQSGMVGIPEISPYGVKVTYMLDNVSKLGGAIIVQSIRNPAANGQYCIYKLSFNVASRDTPFYYTAEAYRI